MEKSPNFPQEFAHLEPDFIEFRKQIDQIDKQIENMPPDKGNVLKPSPPGTPKFREVSRVYKIKMLEDQKLVIQQGMMNIAKNEVASADREIQKEVMYKTEMFAHPSKFSDKNEQELKDASKDDKDIDQSSEYAFKKLFDAKYLANDEDKAQLPKNLDAKEEVDVINAFVNKLQHPESKQEDKENKQPTFEKEGAEAKEDMEDKIDNFLNRTSYSYSDNRNDIIVPSKDDDLTPNF